MAKEYNILGRRVRVNDNVTRGGAVDMLVQRGELSPEFAAQAVGEPIGRAETGGALNEFLIGAGRSYAERSFGALPSDIEAPGTPAAFLGGISPLVAASFAAPATIVGQGVMQGGLEAVRQGATPLSIGLSAAGGGLGQGLGQLAQRTVTGIAGVAANMARSRPVVTTVESFFGKQFARSLKGGGGFARIDEFNQNLLNNAALKAILAPVKKGAKITKEALNTGARRIGRLYNDFYDSLPDVVDMSAAAKIVDDIPSSVLPRKARLLENLNSGTKQGYKDADAMMRDLVPSLKGNQAGQWSDEIVRARQELTALGGDEALLREANKRWNILKTLEEMDSVVKTGDAPAGQLVSRFRRQNKRGLSGFVRGIRTQVDDVDDLADIAGILAADPVPIGSETFSRAATLGPGMIALGGVMTGNLTPEEALGIAGLPLAGQVFGPAAFGRSINALSQATGALGAEGARQLSEGLQR